MVSGKEGEEWNCLGSENHSAELPGPPRTAARLFIIGTQVARGVN